MISSPIRAGVVMRGWDHQSGSLFSYIDLEKRIRPDHPLRTIRRLVDDALASLDRTFTDLYAALALQLHARLQVSVLCGGLMSAPPSRPSNDEGWLNAPLRQSDRDAPDLLHRPGNLQAWR